MIVPALLGIPDATLGAGLGVAWLLVLGIATYRYLTGSQSPEQFLAVVSVGAFWLAYSLLQISTAVSGVPEILVVGLAAGFFLTGIVAGIRWWDSRSTDIEEQTTP
ncbi:hypothetical protein [Halobellus marinus]|uniref:hypothetical protein n=1 Tax=Halobellus TaxID=1073986 RepID=UPI0028ACFEA5|nr:hypothetical protein [Halobellus sp. DFY28]